jgi:histidinol dehydrogenase
MLDRLKNRKETNMIGPIKLKELPAEEADRLLARNRLNLEEVKPKVLEIIQNVKEKGDEALLYYTEVFDGVKLEKGQLKVSAREIKQSYRKISRSLLNALKKAAKNIGRIHLKQLPKEKILANSKGIKVVQLFRPLDSVGIYVPGGKASYPSTALMLSIPAKIAGVKKIVACTPPGRGGEINPSVLVALDLAGVNEIFRVGGVQAIAAMAYGTETIPKTCKIFGPGNIYVTAAKMLVYGEVGIDFPAGPTELLIFSDDEKSAKLIFLDLLSQAEHDLNAVPIFLTTSEKLAWIIHDKIREELEGSTSETFKNWGAILIVENIEEAADYINRFAPEHLEIISRKPGKLLRLLRNVGSVSVGKYTPVSVIDYAVGVNHVLPTSGAAKYASEITVTEFMRTFTVQTLTRKALKSLSNIVSTLAETEGLKRHSEAVRGRFRNG